MKGTIWQALAVCALTASHSVVTASAATVIKVDVDFAFRAGDESFPAGSYELSIDAGRRMLKVTANNRKEALVPYVARLSSRSDIKQDMLVFDYRLDESFLAELYAPGEDGYLFKGCPEKHEHVKVESHK